MKLHKKDESETSQNGSSLFYKNFFLDFKSWLSFGINSPYLLKEKMLVKVAKRGKVKFGCLLLNIELKILESCDKLMLNVLLPL